MRETKDDVVEHVRHIGSAARTLRLPSPGKVTAALCLGVVALVAGCSGTEAEGGGEDVDSGTTSTDGGTTSTDGGTTPTDSGTPPSDSGTTPSDSGTADATPPGCGDGNISAPEVCDDGNRADGDGCSATCAVATCYVPVSHPTVTAALADAACTTVYVHSGTYEERLTIERDVTIRGVGALAVELDGTATGTVVSVADGKTVTLENLTLKNGRAPNGGGIVNAGALTLRDAKVIDNVASDTACAGGGIFQSSGSLLLENTLVAHNHAQTTGSNDALTGFARGGGIFLAGGALTLSAKSKVEENDVLMKTPHGVGQGGGIYASATTTVLLTGESVVRLNTIEVDGDTAGATASGGGIHMNDGTLDVKQGSAIDSNKVTARVPAGGGLAEASGGGAYLEGPNLVVRLEDAFVRTNEANARGDANLRPSGGGMYVSGGSLTGLRTTVSGNKASGVGGAASTSARAEAGGLHLLGGTATLKETTVSNNTAEASTAGAEPYGVVYGGGINASSELTLEQSTISKNVASGDSQASGGGVLYQGSSLRVENGTIAENKATAANVAVGGALDLRVFTLLTASIRQSTMSGNVVEADVARGGAIYGRATAAGTRLDLRLTSSTLSGNEAKAVAVALGGAIYAESRTGKSEAKADVTLSSATITGNKASGTAAEGGGIYAVKGLSSVTMRNTILASNTALVDPDCVAKDTSITSAGYNLIGAAAAGCTVGGDLTGNLSGDPGLAPLASNGGPTQTQALLTASPAKNAGNPAGCTDEDGALLAVDQRGSARISGGRCDMGSVESF